jgi:H+/Cl- antiporter ClcA
MKSFWIRRSRLGASAHYRDLLMLSVVVGVAVGLFSAAFLVVWKVMHHLAWDHLPHLYDRIWFSALMGLLIGLILHRLFDPGSMAAIVHHYHRKGYLPLKDNVPILPVSFLGLVGGQSAGPEGALTQAGGSIGSWTARLFYRPRFTRLLTLAGMGAGFGAFLGAPVGGAVLWLEMLHDRGLEYYEAIVPTLVASATGYLVIVLLTGHGIVTAWPVSGDVVVGQSDLYLALAVGVVCAAVVAVYAWLFRWTGRVMKAWSAPIYVRTTAAGLLIGLLGYAFPLSYFYGSGQVAEVFAGTLSVWMLAGVLLAKMLAASVTIKGHWQGGLIIPHLFMGAVVGQIAVKLAPGLHPVPVTLMAMAAFNAAATQTPLASALIVLALTGFGHPVPIFLASLSGFLAGQRIRLIEHKQPRTRRPNFHLPAVEGR